MMLLKNKQKNVIQIGHKIHTEYQYLEALDQEKQIRYLI